MKVNLGSGLMLLNGWINADRRVHKTKDGKVTDVIFDAPGLPFKSNSCTKVACIHMIEHLTYDDALVLLREVRRVLAPGGVAIFEAPDIRKALLCAKSDRQLAEFLFGALNELRKDLPEYGHRWGWTQEALVSEARAAGLKVLHVGDGTTHLRPERDFRVEVRV